MDQRVARLLLLIGLLAGFLSLKLQLNAVADDFGIDGAYYLNIARHVRDGEGLVTDLSLFHAGFSTFPAPTPVYPIWPLVLGYTARIIPLELAAVWLPTLLAFGTLVLAYQLAVSMWDKPLFPGLWETPNAGHLIVVALGLNDRFFEYTSKPFTEGLSFFLSLLALFRLRAFYRAPGALRGLEIGVWLGILFLVRAQNLILLLAVFAALGWSLLVHPQRGRTLGATVAVGVGLGLTLLPQYLRLSGFSPTPLQTLINFQEFQLRPELSRIDVLVKTNGLGAWLADRANGFLIAYDETSTWSYRHNFGMLHWAPLAALPLWLASGRERLGQLLRRDRLFETFFLIFGIGSYLSLHTLHKPNFTSWNFALRHALPNLALFVPALVFLCSYGPRARLLAIFLLSSSIHQYASETADLRKEVPEKKSDRAKRVALLAWIEAQPDPELRIAMPAPQPISRFTDDVGYHWIHADSTLGDLRLMFTELGADVLVYPKDEDEGERAFQKNKEAFDAFFVAVPDPPTGWGIWQRRTEAPAAEQPTPEENTDASPD